MTDEADWMPLGMIREDLELGWSLAELESAGDTARILKRARKLERYYNHYEPILRPAEDEIERGVTAERRNEIIDEVAVALGLQAGKKDRKKMNALLESFYLALRYEEQLYIRAMEAMDSYQAGDLTNATFPNEVMWQAALAVCKIHGGSTDPCSMRQRLERAISVTGLRVPTPRGNTF